MNINESEELNSLCNDKWVFGGYKWVVNKNYEGGHISTVQCIQTRLPTCREAGHVFCVQTRYLPVEKLAMYSVFKQGTYL